MAQIRMKTKSIQITDETWSLLEELANDEKTSVSAIIRKFIVTGIEKTLGEGKENEKTLETLQIENKYLKAKIADQEDYIEHLKKALRDNVGLFDKIAPLVDTLAKLQNAEEKINKLRGTNQVEWPKKIKPMGSMEAWLKR